MHMLIQAQNSAQRWPELHHNPHPSLPLNGQLAPTCYGPIAEGGKERKKQDKEDSSLFHSAHNKAFCFLFEEVASTLLRACVPLKAQWCGGSCKWDHLCIQDKSESSCVPPKHKAGVNRKQPSRAPALGRWGLSKSQMSETLNFVVQL